MKSADIRKELLPKPDFFNLMLEVHIPPTNVTKPVILSLCEVNFAICAVFRCKT